MAFITNRAIGGVTTLGKRLGELISHADRLDMLVGFFYFSGVKILADALRNRPQLKMRVLVGMDAEILVGRRILLPQAAHHFLPIYSNEVVTLIKETSVVGYIAVLDLTKISDLVRSRTYEAFFALILTAVVYFVIQGIMVRLVRMIQKKIDPRRRSDKKILEGIDIKDWDLF